MKKSRPFFTNIFNAEILAHLLSIIFQIATGCRGKDEYCPKGKRCWKDKCYEWTIFRTLMVEGGFIPRQFLKLFPNKSKSLIISDLVQCLVCTNEDLNHHRNIMSDAIKMTVNTIVTYYCIYCHFYCIRRDVQNTVFKVSNCFFFATRSK